MPDISIIPKPQKITIYKGTFPIASNIPILTDAANKKNAVYLKRLLSPLPKQKVKSGYAVHLNIRTKDNSLGKEGHLLKITPKEITIEALTAAGISWGKILSCALST